jgi:hypothetical protein
MWREFSFSVSSLVQLKKLLFAFVWIRFPDMKTEWLALWIHFLWAGLLIMLFCLVTWWKIGSIGKNLSSQRRRVLSMAVMVSFCLILNTFATMFTSAKLEEWGQTADMALTCAIRETFNTRNWEA